MLGTASAVRITAVFPSPAASGVQRNVISLLRNMVSDVENAHLKPLILEQGAEELINAARAAHPVCDDVSFACLRDLGCDYKASLYLVT